MVALFRDEDRTRIDVDGDVLGWSSFRPSSATPTGTATRTIRRWVTTAGERLYADTGDDGWTYLGPHDLRRTWGTLLVERKVEPGLVMEWGGWEDWDTFREHYLGAYSLDAQQRGMEKVDWL